MRVWLASWLRYVADALDSTVVYVEAAALVPEPDPLAVATAALVAQADEQADTGGEYKRRWVYGKLVKAFPEKRRSTLSMAIEVAVAARRG